MQTPSYHHQRFPENCQLEFERCRIFQKNISFMDYVEWALDVPIYFLERWGQKMAVGHPSFRNFLERGIDLPNGRGRTYATPGDWQLHLTTVFPWVRLRNYIELRAFDINASDIVLAIVALVKGLFYSASSLNAVEALVGTYDKATVEALLQEATRYGLEAQLDDMSFRDMLSNLIDIAKNGLCDQEKHEYIFLKPFEALALKRRAEDLNMLASFIRRDLSSNGLLTMVCKRWLIRKLEDRFASQSSASRSGIALGVSPCGVSSQGVDHRLEGATIPWPIAIAQGAKQLRQVRGGGHRRLTG